jgi:hypothetical protein
VDLRSQLRNKGLVLERDGTWFAASPTRADL